MMVIHNKGEHKAFLVGRQAGLRSYSEAMEQLTEQLRAARAELQEARADHAARMAACKAHFDRECKAIRREMEEMIAELKGLDSFAKMTRTEADRLN
jgi:hypothetical protein